MTRLSLWLAGAGTGLASATVIRSIEQRANLHEAILVSLMAASTSLHAWARSHR